MSVNTSIYLLVYKGEKLSKAIELENFRFMRFDDGIYGKIWDSQGMSDEFRNSCKNWYNLSDEEFKALQFKNYWCEDLLEQKDDELESNINFNKVPVDNIVNPKYLKELLEKVIKAEDKLTREYQDKFLSNTFENPKNDVFKKKQTFKSFLTDNSEIEKQFLDIKSRTTNQIKDKRFIGFTKLITYLIGILTILELEDNIEVQFVFHQE